MTFSGITKAASLFILAYSDTVSMAALPSQGQQLSNEIVQDTVEVAFAHLVFVLSVRQCQVTKVGFFLFPFPGCSPDCPLLGR
jgi:hypothetical protein